MTKPPTQQDKALASEARMVAIVIAVTMVLWMGAQWLGGRFGLEARYVFLFDLAAMAAFFWALVVTWRIWQRQKRQ
ncbi:hypothetical protein GVY41_13740 [Frigidibacter albus]|uniref:DUF5337 domain-containing protein n=2 Tax=Frigidibacter TaxID=1775705 RepID=A0A6L8VLY3_9RHOB|nr:DUF5337 domain-containing protein [Frigidibacter albus]MZQ90150.1 hypothetical protein [Frigidibacter albus]NBE32058.1 hypothetical protein [Frigidibacter albus]GGH57108.1 hypothetical protein GCM10011341_26230 [Frigidibacter albus]